MYIRKIALVAAVCVGGLAAACGQTGALYLPTEPEAANRATLPQTLLPSQPSAQPHDAQTLPAPQP